MQRPLRLLLFVLLLASTSLPCALASTIVLTGSITQSTGDGTGPALNNSSLNNIADGQAFTLTLNSATAITGPDLYNLTGSSLALSVAAAPALENAFGTVILNITADGAFDDFNLFACVTGGDCFAGSALSASFRIPAASIGGTGVAVTGLDQPHPLDLLEDGGTTDIQGSFRSYTNTTAQAVTPEPSSGSLCVLALLALFVAARFSPQWRTSLRRLS